MVTDRVTQRVCVMGSSEGGMDIEEVAATHPEKIHKVFVDPAKGLTDSFAPMYAGHEHEYTMSRPDFSSASPIAA